MTDRERWNLRGPVQSCLVERTWYLRRCKADACETEERADNGTVEFRTDGSLARAKSRNSDGSEGKRDYEYDDRGRLLKIRIENAGRADEQVFEYDPAGRVARLIARPHDGGERLVESYEYDGAGRKKKTFFVDEASRHALNAWGVEGTDAAYGAQGAATIITFYDERDQPGEVVFLDSDSQELTRVELRYDEAGRLVEEVQSKYTLPAEMLACFDEAQKETVRAAFSARRTHRYDELGRRVQTRLQMGPLGGDAKTVIHNDYGDPIREITEHEQREYGMDDEGHFSPAPTKETVHRSEARFLYEYDASGNWVVKIVEGRGGDNQEFTRSSMERRTITYFE